MKDYQSTLQKIQRNVAEIDKREIKKILILYEEKVIHIGDFCIRFDKLTYFRSFFNNAAITINFSKKNSDKIYGSLLKNNPNLDCISSLEWDDIAFENYDLVFCIAYDEEKLLEYFHLKYGYLITGDQLELNVFSISTLLLAPDKNSKYIFPLNQRLIEFGKTPRPGELYLSGEEIEWGNQWLKSKGLKEAEELYILLDSASRREKVINIDTYFSFLTFLLKKENSKILIFDENSVGKEEFYSAWLGVSEAGKMIFSNSLGLRKDLCIIGSRYTKLIFGPCTGIMHCASGIYNNFVNNGMNINDVPLMVTYTGQYLEGENNANSWWSNSPLINCLLLKEEKNRKKILLLHEMPEGERDFNDSLSCSEYTAELLIDLINRKLKAYNH
jgi:hypothetical protein